MADFLGGLSNFMTQQVTPFANRFTDAMAGAQLNALRFDDPEAYEGIMQERALGNLRQSELDLRRQDLEQRRQERAEQIRQRQARMQALGNLSGRISQATGIPQEALGGLIEAGAGLETIGQLGTIFAPKRDVSYKTVGDRILAVDNQTGQVVPVYEGPSELEEGIRMLGQLEKLTPEQREMLSGVVGDGVNITNILGGEQDPFTEKLSEQLGKERATDISNLETEAKDLLSEATGAQQALDILERNPDLAIHPTAGLSNQVKSFFAPFLTPEQLQNVSDFQTLESQLIRNRFDVTKVLKGAITEQEQAAAQRVAGRATGTREGLAQTLRNNIAFSTLRAHENETRAQYMLEQGKDYSPAKFREYYKELGEQGLRPTLDQMLGTSAVPQTVEEMTIEELRAIAGQ